MARRTDTRLTTRENARAYFAARFRKIEQEELAVAFLDDDGRVLGDTVVDGAPDRVPLPLRRVVGEALRLDAHALVLAHTHPGGRAEPSAGDLAATRRLAELADALGMRLHDHLILLPGGEAVSFRALGLL